MNFYIKWDPAVYRYVNYPLAWFDAPDLHHSPTHVVNRKHGKGSKCCILLLSEVALFIENSYHRDPANPPAGTDPRLTTPTCQEFIAVRTLHVHVPYAYTD
jgi:hypothetical protein